ncbi:MAG: SDR family oxidoreductase, partial [Paraburkholderia sp.]|uniref:SDR family oxidoreductase n=1 Tax=Burkholderiaceae TaxID=119060 RepID=UPI0010F809D3|nr:SDR family oxidoreductase [Burkholderia sp. 4M9327F10]
MKVLVCGARGFLGAAICECLVQAGHTVVEGVREPRTVHELAVDFSRDLTPDAWLPRLAGIDAVVNAVGILVERKGQRFADIHEQAPIALFTACSVAGVRRVVQVSALGAERGGSAYFDSKLAADTFLATQPVEWQICRPSLVYGAEGKSASFFRALASLPVCVVPAQGRQMLQPIHIDDFAQAILRLLDPATPARQCVELVGATRVAYRDMLSSYRRQMGFESARTLSIPAWLIGATAAMLDPIPGAILTRDTWKMLRAGNVGDVVQTASLLRRPPKGVDGFIDAAQALPMREQALAHWRPGLLRGVLALVWLWTALVSLFMYPLHDSLALLARVHVTGPVATAALYGAGLLDLAFGAATLLMPSRRLWFAQAALIAFYTVVIAIAMPEFVIHPFGPLLKNLPILAVLFLLVAEEKTS